MSPPTSFATLPDSLRHPARLLIALTAVGLAASPLPAAEITVPSDVATIQGAIDLAADGDTVVVSPGIYFEAINFLGKALTVRSLSGPAVTIIDAEPIVVAQGFATVVTFASGEGPGSVLEGFTVRGGSSFAGGGIICESSSPTIRGNTIRENSSECCGGGVFCLDSNATIEGNEFVGNLSLEIQTSDGGCSFPEPPCSHYTYYGSGGGLSIGGGAVTVRGNRFQGNEAGRDGGALALVSTSGTVVVSNIMEENSSILGGAISIRGVSSVAISHLVARGNAVWGPGVLFGSVSPDQAAGAAIYNDGSAGSVVSISHATILANSFGQFTTPLYSDGFSVFASLSSSTTLRNSIVRGGAPTPPGTLVSSTIDASFSNIEGNAPGLGNIDVAPGFALGPLGDLYLAQVTAGQSTDSPCVDAGDPADSAPDDGTTRTDHAADTGAPDLGYHYPGVGARFRRGDCNGDSAVDIADAIHLVSTIFPGNGGGGTFLCADACDTNDDGAIDIADAIATLGALFGNSPLPLPTPGTACGSDPTDDSLGCFIPSDC